MLRTAVAVVARGLAALLAVAAALVLHLPTRVGRAAVRDLAARILPGVTPGQLRVGRVEALTPWEIRVAECSYRDDRGDPIAEGVTVTVRPAWRLARALAAGTALPPITVRARRVWARAPYFTPPPPHAAAPSAPPAAPRAFEVPSLRVEVDSLVGAIPGVPLQARGIRVDLGLGAAHGVTTVHLRDARGTFAALGLGDEVLRARGRAAARPSGLTFDGSVSLRGGDLACDLDARLDEAGAIAARARGCTLAAAALDRLTGAAPGASRGLAVRLDDATVTGAAGGELAVRADGAANGERVGLSGRASSTRQAVDVTVHHLSVDRLAPGAPPSDLDGTIHLEHAAAGGAHALTVDTAGLVAAVAGVPVPPVRARARLAGSTLTLDELTARDIGLAARGEADLATGATRFHAAADVDTPELARYPWVHGRASGALRAHVEVDGGGAGLTARVRGDARRLRVARVGVRDASFEVTASRAPAGGPPGATAVTAAVAARGLEVPGTIAPADVTVRAAGDPAGRVRATVTADGNGLLAALGQSPAGATGPTGGRAEIDLDLTDLRRVRARVVRSSLSLRGAQAQVTGDLAVLAAAAGGRAVDGRMRLETAGHGALAVTVRGRRVAATFAAFDLRWLRPFVPALPPDLEGVIDGTADVDPANLRNARASWQIHRGRQRAVGGFDGTVELTPAGGVSTLRAAIDTSRGTRLAAELEAVIPARVQDPDAWVAQLRGGRITLDRVDLSAYDDLLPLGVGARGTLSAALALTRPEPGAPLTVTAHLDGRELTGGVRVLSRFFPVVDPLALRVATCFALRRAVLDEAPTRIRVALGPSRRGDVPVEPPACEGSTPLLGRSWATVDGSLRGPWLSALQRAARDLATARRELAPDTRERLRAATADLRATVGPLRRSEWPLHVPSTRLAGDRLRFLRPPDLTPDSAVSLEARAQGPLLSLGATVEGEFSAGALRQAGLGEPLVTRLAVSAGPTAGGTILGPIQLSVGGMVELGTHAPPAERSQIAVDIQARATGAGLLARGADAVSLQRFDVDTRDLALERFSWAHERGLHGTVTLHLEHTDNAAVPLTATATVTGLHAELPGDVGERRESRPVNVGLLTRLVSRGDRGGWTLRSCVEAGAGAVSASCDPLSTQAPERPGALRATLALPVEGELLAPRPRVDRATLHVLARGFRLETFTPLVRSEAIAGIGGALDAALRWEGGATAPLDGALRISEGHADIVSLGERLRDLEVAVRATGTGLRVDRLGFVLGSGRMDIDGSVDLAGALAPRPPGAPARPPAAALANVLLTGEARGLPVGVEGNTYGWVDGGMAFGMRFTPEGARGELAIHRAQVRLKEEQTRSLQPLGQDESVFVVGRTVLNAVPSAAPYPMALTVDLSDPMLLRRSDLAVAIRGHVQTERERAGWGVAGTIESASNQGWFSVLGKRFELDRLRVVLDGAVSINPQLDIAAHHNAAAGDRLTATVGGRLRAPRMEFASATDPGLSQAEVLAMIALGRRDAQSANANGDLGQQMGAAFGSLIGAMTFGTLSRGLRFVPTLVLEPGQGNAGRYGAGVSLGPRFYVQLTYGAASALGQSSGAGTTTQVFRGLVEFAISQAWSTSAAVASGVGGDGASAGIDVFWSP